MFSLSATQARVGTTPRATTRRAPSRGTALVVRAEEKAAAPAAAPAPWTAPKLNPNTPSPIFGGSTGGLLRKAQVRIRFSFNDFFLRACDGWMDGRTMDDDATDVRDGEGSERMRCISRDLEIAVWTRRTRATRFETVVDFASSFLVPGPPLSKQNRASLSFRGIRTRATGGRRGARRRGTERMRCVRFASVRGDGDARRGRRAAGPRRGMRSGSGVDRIRGVSRWKTTRKKPSSGRGSRVARARRPSRVRREKSAND